MYKVLIVDDKKTIRDGLIKHVDWLELGFEVAGDFSSAADALKHLERECADVLLTDIVMPDVTGLQLIHEVNLINPAIKVVILSAYEKFEYAQQAIRLGAFSYLTKPVNIEKLKAEFMEICQILNRESVDRCAKLEAGDLAREQYLNDLAMGFLSNDDASVIRARELGLSFPKGSFLVVRALISGIRNAGEDSDGPGGKESCTAVAEALAGYLGKLGPVFVFRINPQEVSVLLFPSHMENVKQDLAGLSEAFAGNETLLGVGKTYGPISRVHDSYHEAGMALQYHIVDGRSILHFFEDIEESVKGRALITPDVEETILTHLHSKNEGPLLQYVMGIVDNTIRIEQSNSGLIYDACVELILVVNKYMAMNITIRKPGGQDDYHAIKSLLQKKDYAEIRQYMSDYMKQCANLIRLSEEKSVGLIVEKAKQYIQEHYRENLNLSRISRVVYVNPTYLSRLFKEKEGENFIDYLSRVRIGQAKKLLEDLSLRVCDISEMVGYESRKHFGKTFKDITGMSPRECRERMAASRSSENGDQPADAGM